MSVSNTTSNTTPLPVSADATDAAPLQISDEAREAANNERNRIHRNPIEWKPIGYHVQLAINSATEKLQRENDALFLSLGGIQSCLAEELSLSKKPITETEIRAAVNALVKERDQLRAELLATQAQVEQLKTAIKEASRILMREGYPSSASALQSTLSLTPTTALTPIVEAHVKSLKALEEYDRLVANGDFYFNCKAHLSGPAQAANKYALQLLGVKEEK